MNAPNLLPTASTHQQLSNSPTAVSECPHSQADPARSNRGTSNDWLSCMFASRANIKWSTTNCTFRD